MSLEAWPPNDFRLPFLRDPKMVGPPLFRDSVPQALGPDAPPFLLSNKMTFNLQTRWPPPLLLGEDPELWTFPPTRVEFEVADPFFSPLEAEVSLFASFYFFPPHRLI